MTTREPGTRRRIAAAVSAWLALQAVAIASGASADEPGRARIERRALPDYDGREDEERTGDAWLWIPRILFAPLHLFSEYVIRRPVAFAARRVPIFGVPRISSGGETHLRGAVIFPTAMIDFGFAPSVGFYGYLNDVLAPNTSFRIHAGTWGPDWLKVAASARIETIPDVHALVVRFDAVRRRDLLFHGIGPSSRDAPARYAADRIDALVRFEAALGAQGDFAVTSGVRWVDFDDRGCCDEPTIGERVQRGELDYPAAYPYGYLTYRQSIDLALDTRRELPAPGNGVRATVHAEHSVDLHRPLSRGWIRWGATAGAFFDLTSENRTLAVWAYALFADPLAEDPVPFNELAQAGGPGPLRGFRPGRLYGRSALALTTEYRWPIWHRLDGTLFTSVGNVFGAHLDGFSPELCRLSFGLGVRSGRERDESLDLIVAFGTETFEDGAAIESFRLAIGLTRGF